MLDLTDPAARENALLDLSKKREAFPDLAPILWHSFGVVSALLQEIVSIYPLLSPPSLTAHASNRVCNALALLQCVASHPDTRALFLHGKSCQPPYPVNHVAMPRHSAESRVASEPQPQDQTLALELRALKLMGLILGGWVQPTFRCSSTRSSTP